MINCPFCAEPIKPEDKECPHCRSLFEVMCPFCAEPISARAIKCKHCGSQIEKIQNGGTRNDNSQYEVNRLADMEKASGIIWICIAILQICAVYTMFAGIWNLVAGISRFGIATKLRAKDPEIPALYQSTAQLIVLAIVNLILGGVIGLLAVAFDFYIRDQVLKNSHLFIGENHVNI